MTIMVRDLPKEERPREKLITYGASALSNAELLAVLLHTGTREHSVLHLAESVLGKYKERGMAAMAQMSVRDLADIHGIGPSKAATILAAVELGRRLSQKAAAKVQIVHGPEDAAHFAMPHLRYEQKEHFAVLLLNTKNHILGLRDISIGSLSASIVHPREVFSMAIRYAAASMILVHNHPSGDPTPSEEDIRTTKMLIDCGNLLRIKVVDHLVIGDGRYVSMQGMGYM